MENLKESEAPSHQQRRRKRTVRTLTVVALLMLVTFAAAAVYYQGWAGNKASPTPPANAGCQSADPSLTPGAVTINVYNATDRAGLAGSVAKSLRTQGFKVATVANDPTGKSMTGVGEVRHGPTGAAGASLAAARLSGAKVVRDERTDNTVDVVLGRRFRALSTPAKTGPPKAGSPSPSC